MLTSLINEISLNHCFITFEKAIPKMLGAVQIIILQILLAYNETLEYQIVKCISETFQLQVSQLAKVFTKGYCYRRENKRVTNGT